MSQTASSLKQQKYDAGVTRVAMNLEVDVIPVSDAERSKQFYQHLGWRLDADGVADIAHRSAYLQVLLSGADQRKAHAGNAQLGEVCDLMFVQQFGNTGRRRRFDRYRVDWREFLNRWFGYGLFGDLAMLALQFDDPHIEPFDFLEGDQVDFTQEFNDLGLGP